MSTRFASGRLNSVYFTSTGAISGAPCKVAVQGESAFASAYASNNVHAADGTPHTQTIDRGVKGIEFTLVFAFISEAVLALLVAQMNAALLALSTVRVVVDSLTDFDVMASPISQGGALYTFEGRSGGIAKNVQIKFVSVGVGV